MSYGKTKNGSYVHNCLIERRENEKAAILFYVEDSEIGVYLNGYAVIPLEKYKELLGEKFDGEYIEKADKELYT